MVRAQILTHWVPGFMADGTPTNTPAACLDFPGGTFADVTGQPSANLPTSPNLLVVECVVSDVTFAAILAHPDYGPGAVLWSETL